MFNHRAASLVVVLLLAGNTLFAAEPSSLVLVKTIQLKGVAGKLDHLAVDAKGERLFIANKPNNTLDIVDLKTSKLVRQIADQGKISGVAFAADLNMIYVGNGAGVCNAFEGQDYRLVFSAKAASADNVHYHSGTHTVYVGAGKVLLALDAKTGESKASVNMPGEIHGFRIDKKAGKIYVVLTQESMVAVVDTASHEITAQFTLTRADGGSPIAQDAANHLVFVGCRKPSLIVVIDVRTGKEVASFAISAGIDDLHFDAKHSRLYASCSDGVLLVIEKKGDEYETLEKLVTPKDSRTCVWSSGKLYVGVPKQEGQDGPEIQVYEARPVLEVEAKRGK